MHVIQYVSLQCSNVNSSVSQAGRNAVQAIARLFLNMSLSSCKFKYNKRNKLILWIKWYLTVFNVAYVALFVEAKVKRYLQ